jgi:archaellum component FlaC
MSYRKLTIVGVLAPALMIGACNRSDESRDPAAQQAAPADVAAERQQERNDEIAQLDQRVAEIEREYSEASQKVVSEKKTPTTGLREELKEDVTNVKQAVNELRTTTPDNWWNRHEEAMTQAADDVEADVSRLAGKVMPARPSTTTDADGEKVSTEPFSSRRDNFVGLMRVRIDAMKQQLNNIKPSGAQKTEVEDVRARLNKLGDDVDRLKSASPDDWWDVTKARVTEYVDRIDRSVNRLDDVG